MVTKEQLKAHYKGTTEEDERIADYDKMINRMRDLIKRHKQTIDEKTISIAALNVAINQTQINKQEYLDKISGKEDEGFETVIPFTEEQNNE